jgi:hypothetical protein
MNACYTRMGVIARLVADGDFTCSGKHGNCPECGARWSHDHVCEDAARARRVRL